MFTLAILVKHASDLDFFIPLCLSTSFGLSLFLSRRCIRPASGNCSWIHQETQVVVQTAILSIAFRDPSTIDQNPLDLDFWPLP
jgi:hypothetical protein